MGKRKLNVNDSELDNYQFHMLNRINESSCIIEGYPGSGKLTLALKKILQIQTEGRSTWQMIVLTKALKKYIQIGFSHIGIDSNHLDYFWHWKTINECPSTDYIIIYEGQSFSIEDILLIKEKANKAVFIFVEKMPSTIDSDTFHYFTRLREISEATHLPIESLAFSYTIPKKVARLIDYLYGCESLELRCINEGQEKPNILIFKNINEQIEFIFKEISRRNLQEVAIVFRTKKEIDLAYNLISSRGYLVETEVNIEPLPNPYLSWKTKEVKEYLKSNKLFLNNIPRGDLYLEPEKVFKEIRMLRVAYDKKFTPPLKIDYHSSRPKLLTYHSISGIVFESIFLPNCLAEELHLLYRAMTHTSKNLYVMHSGSLSPLLKNFPNELFNSQNIISNPV